MSTLEQIRKQLNKELLHLRATNNSSALVITNIVADIGDIITAQNTIHKSNYTKCSRALIDLNNDGYKWSEKGITKVFRKHFV